MDNKKKKIFIGVAAAITAVVLVVVLVVCLVLFLPKTPAQPVNEPQVENPGPHGGEYVYDFATGKYNKYCTYHSGELLDSFVGGSEQYPLLAKDRESLAALVGCINSGNKNDFWQVKLESDITISADDEETDASFNGIAFAKGKKVMLDLCGKTLANEISTTIENSGELVICDSSEEQSGKIDCTMWGAPAIQNNEGANLTLSNVEVKRSTWGYKPYEELDGYPRGEGFAVIVNHGTATIDGGKIWAWNENVWEDVEYVSGAETLEPMASPLIQNGYEEVQPGKLATLKILGGEFSGGKTVVQNGFNGKVQIDGGSFTTGFAKSTKTDEPVLEFVFTNEAGSEFIINAGTFTAGQNANGILQNSGTFSILGGEFVASSCKFVISVKAGTVTISEDAVLNAYVTEGMFDGNNDNGVSGDFTQESFDVAE